MSPIVFAVGFLHYVLGFLLFFVSVFLILLVLVQRGRGGGLTGALGGMGGQSAFGAKAGDMFTRVTMVTATIWILLCLGAIRFLTTTDDWGPDAAERPTVENDELLEPVPEVEAPTEMELPETEFDLPDADLDDPGPIVAPPDLDDEAAVEPEPDDAVDAPDDPPADAPDDPPADAGS